MSTSWSSPQLMILRSWVFSLTLEWDLMRPVFAPLPRMFMWYFQFPMEMTSSLIPSFIDCISLLARVSTLSVSCTSQRKSLHSNSHLRVYFWKKRVFQSTFTYYTSFDPYNNSGESYINQEHEGMWAPYSVFLTVSQE